MDILKNIVIRLGLVALLFCGANFIYNQFFFIDFLQDHGTLLYYQQNALDADYLYYSASSDFSYDPKNDTNTDRISTIIDDNTTIKLKHVTEAGHHAGIFAPAIERLDENEVKGIVIVLNYRSFSPEWLESYNENSLLQSRVLYEDRPNLANRVLMSLNAYDQVPDKEREEHFLAMFRDWKLPLEAPKNTIDSWCQVEKYGDWRNPKRQLADHLIKNYAFDLHENSPRMSDFDQIAKSASEKNLNLIFVIIPENVELADSLLGEDIISIMNKNRAFLKKRYHKPNENQHVLDIMDILKDENFTDRDYPTEHYNFEGRNKVAMEVANLLNTIEK